MLAERMRVLITVKAAPEPSKKYIDTVCVAGVRLDQPEPSWIRLYPVPFRHLSGEQKYAKYQIIDVDVNPAKSDDRHESRRPVWDSVELVGKPATSLARVPALLPLTGPTMCELQAGVAADLRAQSLGLVRVRALTSVAIEPHPGWTPAQIQAMTAHLEQPELLGDVDEVPPLVAPRLVVRYAYTCMTPECAGHRQRILDWELAALQHRFRHVTVDALEAVIREKFEAGKFSEPVLTYLFVGNFAHPAKRRNFAVLGVWTTPRATETRVTLF
ncbi:hypothetical protein [Clavibacter sp. Sh2126]|uniref:hypothetical protein n=1 Tax=unclassified Clavibacter TaxID=2626594 RepID=UPI0039E178F4